MTSLVEFLSRTGFWVLGLAVAAFLVLYWALRGAPIGQGVEDGDVEAPRGGYRDRVIAAVVVGLLLIGAGSWLAMTRSVLWSLPAFALGFGLVLTLIAYNHRYRHASPALRRTLEFSNTALGATLLAGILIVVNVLAFRYGGRGIDFTEERAFSLSSLTMNQLTSLKRPVTFTVLFGDSERAVRQSDRVRQLLDLYKGANPREITVATVNPYREPERFEELAKRIPEIAVMQGGGVLVEYGAGDNPSHVLVRNNDLFEITPGGQFSHFESRFHGEDALTSALLSLREEKKPKVVFTTGHGEPSINDVDMRKTGLGALKTRLAATGANVVELNLLRDEIPEDTALLVIAGPKTPFKPEELTRIKTYSNEDKPMLILLGNQETTGLEPLLKSFNIELGKGLVLDLKLSLRGRLQLVYVPITGEISHPIVESLAKRAVLMPSAAPIHLLETRGQSPPNPKVIATPLLRTSDQSWAETDLTKRSAGFDRAKDERGPLTVGVSVTNRPAPSSDKEPAPRLVLLSSKDVADNPYLEGEPTNGDLLMNSIGWLRGRPDLKGIAPKTHKSLTLVADPVLRTRLMLVPTVMATLLIVGLGLVTYNARRQ